MSILNEQEYNQVYRILSSHTANNDDIIAAINHSVLPKLSAKNSFLDIGPGTGFITNAIRPHFQSAAVVEPSAEFCNMFAAQGYDATAAEFQNIKLQQQYDYVLCSHVLYNVDISTWPQFINKMIGNIKPGGMGTIVLSAARGVHHDMCCTLNAAHKSSGPIINFLTEQNIKHTVDEAIGRYCVDTFDEMVTLCRFSLLEDCYTPEKYAQLSHVEREQLDARIRDYANSLQRADGKFQLDADVDIIHIMN